MAEVQPLRALHYDPGAAGPLSDLIAPPYDVIDAGQRAALAARSPYNVVHIDLPEGNDPYARAADLLERWQGERSIMVTTNLLDVDELREQIGTRTVSRLHEMCEVIPIMGHDLRMQAA